MYETQIHQWRSCTSSTWTKLRRREGYFPLPLALSRSLGVSSVRASSSAYPPENCEGCSASVHVRPRARFTVTCTTLSSSLARGLSLLPLFLDTCFCFSLHKLFFPPCYFSVLAIVLFHPQTIFVSPSKRFTRRKWWASIVRWISNVDLFVTIAVVLVSTFDLNVRGKSLELFQSSLICRFHNKK